MLTHKNFICSFICFLCLFAYSCSCSNNGDTKTAEGKPLVLVSITPQKFFVEKIAGDTVSVQVMVPPGASPHTFEPSPKQVLTAGHARLWFRSGDPFENKAIEALRSYSPKLVIVDLRKGIDLIPVADGHSCCSHHDEEEHDHEAEMDAMDLHIWLSPRLAKKQVETITAALVAAFPSHKALYEKKAQVLSEELDALDVEVAAILKDAKGQTILVSHPAFGYFCHDYSLKQLSVEWEGRDPAPQQLSQVLEQARAANVGCVFLQEQYNNKGAKLIADHLHAATAIIDPYDGDYFQNLRKIAKQFANSANSEIN